jgi:hypothetical protein
MKRETLAVLLLAWPGFAAGPPQPPAQPADCLVDSLKQKDKMQFFVCLNLRRESCEELLRKINAECGATSKKYKVAFDRYTAVRGKANILLDMLVADLRFGVHTDPAQYKQYMKDLGDSIQEFESTDKAFACDGSNTKFLPLLIPLFTTVLSGKIQETLTSWMSGNKPEKEVRAQLLTTQRWKLPSEMGAPFPIVAPAP